MSRTSIILPFAVLLIGPVWRSASAAPDPATRRDVKQPNIVFIFSDDHAYQAISAYGDPRKLLATPNIDRIGREGMRFDRCVVPNSICGPSRASVLTGKYSHRNGFYNNTNSRFDGSQTTFPKLLQAAGYQTAVFGKWHLVSDPTGFDEWHILPGQGVYYNPPMIHRGQRVQHQGYTTDVITDLSLDWLKGRDRDRPFLLMCQHKAPHRQWLPAIRHLSADADRIYPEPATLFDDYAGRASPALSGSPNGSPPTTQSAPACFASFHSGEGEVGSTSAILIMALPKCFVSLQVCRLNASGSQRSLPRCGSGVRNFGVG